MRRLLATFGFLAFAAAGLPAPGDAELLRVWPQWHSGDSFQSFYEYRTGRELVGKWVVLRSQPDERAGFYFVARVKNVGALMRGATFVVRVISPEATQTRVFNFPADLPNGSHVFEIGLTGKDWAGPRILPVAWNVELQAADGRVMAHKSSYLWEKTGR
jgi:hypothetical protein